MRHLVPVAGAALLALVLSISAAVLGLDATTKWALAIPLALLLVVMGVPYALLGRERRAPFSGAASRDTGASAPRH